MVYFISDLYTQNVIIMSPIMSPKSRCATVHESTDWSSFEFRANRIDWTADVPPVSVVAQIFYTIFYLFPPSEFCSIQNI